MQHHTQPPKLEPYTLLVHFMQGQNVFKWFYYFEYVSIYQITREIRKASMQGGWFRFKQGTLFRQVTFPTPLNLRKLRRAKREMIFWCLSFEQNSHPPCMPFWQTESFNLTTKIKVIICIKYQLATYLFRPFSTRPSHIQDGRLPAALNNVHQPSY